MTEPYCPCGVVDDLGDGTCGNCGLRIMTDGEEMPPVDWEAKYVALRDAVTQLADKYDSVAHLTGIDGDALRALLARVEKEADRG